MARLTRYTQQIFGSSASANQIAEYGSLANGTPATYSGSTITPTIVQNLSQYLDGWYTATEGALSPAYEDMNALCYLYAYQLAYSFQAGIPEWDAGTTYYIGQIAQDGSGTIYASNTNGNINHALTNGADWRAPFLPGVTVPNSVPYTAPVTLQANYSTMWPYMQIGSGSTIIVPSSSQLLSVPEITISGTGILQATGTGIIKLFS